MDKIFLPIYCKDAEKKLKNGWRVQLYRSSYPYKLSTLKFSKKNLIVKISQELDKSILIIISQINLCAVEIIFDGYYDNISEKYRTIIKNMIKPLVPWMKEQEDKMKFWDNLPKEKYSMLKKDFSKT